ncbi:MAG: hypothetical protein WCG42_07845 [Parachlamydiaceae bacterium]
MVAPQNPYLPVGASNQSPLLSSAIKEFESSFSSSNVTKAEITSGVAQKALLQKAPGSSSICRESPLQATIMVKGSGGIKSYTLTYDIAHKKWELARAGNEVKQADNIQELMKPISDYAIEKTFEQLAQQLEKEFAAIKKATTPDIPTEKAAQESAMKGQLVNPGAAGIVYNKDELQCMVKGTQGMAKFFLTYNKGKLFYKDNKDQTTEIPTTLDDFVKKVKG